MIHTWLERALRRDRLLVFATIGVLAGLSWGWIAAMGIDMYGPMTGASAWAMTAEWDARRLVLLFTMWAVMMTAMMLPSAAPFLLVYGAVARSAPDRAPAAVRIYALAVGYLFTWTAFSAVATGFQWLLSSIAALTPMMELRSSATSGVLLVMAGIYQLTPAKSACLRACRSAPAQIVEHWSPGTMGALRMGARHGLSCVGCCWALMLLLFAGGVMNLLVIVTLTVFVLVEKLTPLGPWAGRITGGALAAFGIWIAAR